MIQEQWQICTNWIIYIVPNTVWWYVVDVGHLHGLVAMVTPIFNHFLMGETLKSWQHDTKTWFKKKWPKRNLLEKIYVIKGCPSCIWEEKKDMSLASFRREKALTTTILYMIFRLLLQIYLLYVTMYSYWIAWNKYFHFIISLS